jgi:predicted DNA-binding protein
VRGRPKKDGCKSRNIHVRLSDEQQKKLTYMCDHSDSTSSEIVRKAIDTLYNLQRIKY